MPHYNIKFLHTWKTNLNNNTPTTQDTSLVNCQTNITNNTPLKSPHNNVYTQMSHLSPQPETQKAWSKEIPQDSEYKVPTQMPKSPKDYQAIKTS